MLLGQFEGRIEQKHRIAFPKKLRLVLGTKLIITKGLDENLIVISEKDIGFLLEGTKERPFKDRSTRRLQRFLFGNASEVTLDSQGRFLLPEHLIKFAHLEKDVIFVGVRSYVEVWDKKRWEEVQENTKEIESIAAHLVKQDEHQ